jgi:AcrR family transcriptional regulator
MLSSKYQDLLDTATRLFAENGYTAVGIDRIIAEAGVAKMTLYKHFPSKQALILAVLKQRDQQFMQSLQAYVLQYSDLDSQIKAVFDWHQQWFKQADFYGCMFINAAAEFHQTQTEIQAINRAHKQRIIDWLQSLLAAKYAETAAELALQLSLLLDGAIVAAQTTQNPNAIIIAYQTSQLLLSNKNQ